jgi:hypothetical protein
MRLALSPLQTAPKLVVLLQNASGRRRVKARSMWPYTGIVVDPTRQEQGRHQAGHLRTTDQPKAGTVRARTSYLKLKDAKSRCVRTDACFALSVSPPLQRRLEFARRNHNKHFRRSRPGRNRAFQHEDACTVTPLQRGMQRACMCWCNANATCSWLQHQTDVPNDCLQPYITGGGRGTSPIDFKLISTNHGRALYDTKKT